MPTVDDHGGVGSSVVRARMASASAGKAVRTSVRFSGARLACPRASSQQPVPDPLFERWPVCRCETAVRMRSRTRVARMRAATTASGYRPALPAPCWWPTDLNTVRKRFDAIPVITPTGSRAIAGVGVGACCGTIADVTDDDLDLRIAPATNSSGTTLYGCRVI